MKKFKTTGFVLVAFLVVVIVYYLVSPLFIDKRVDESVADIQSVSLQPQDPQVISSGKFEGLANHSAEGTAKIISIDGKHYVRFEDDFKSTNGPDVHVYLGKSGKYDPNTGMGLIKGNIGAQNYEIPSSINIVEYDEVWIWCKAFSVPFGKAPLSK